MVAALFAFMEISQTMTDTLLARPIGFKLGQQHCNLYPLTLGQLQLCSATIQMLSECQKSAAVDINLQLTNAVGQHLEECLLMIARCMVRGKACLDSRLIAAKMRLLRKYAKAEDIVTLCATILIQGGNVAVIERETRITREKDEFRRICEAKEAKGSYTFGGVSIWGSLIAPIAEKFGWTLDYILWGITWDNLRLLLDDAPQQIMLSADEIRRIRPTMYRNAISADDPRNLEKIKQMNFD